MPDDLTSEIAAALRLPCDGSLMTRSACDCVGCDLVRRALDALIAAEARAAHLEQLAAKFHQNGEDARTKARFGDGRLKETQQAQGARYAWFDAEASLREALEAVAPAPRAEP